MAFLRATITRIYAQFLAHQAPVIHSDILLHHLTVSAPLRALAKILTFVTLLIASTSSAWAACGTSLTASLSQYNHTYSPDRPTTISFSGDINKALTGCAFAGGLYGDVLVSIANQSVKVTLSSTAGTFSGTITLAPGLPGGSHALIVKYLGAGVFTPSSKSFNYTVSRAYQAIYGLPYKTVTYAPQKTVFMNIVAQSGYAVTVTNGSPATCSVGTGGLSVRQAGTCTFTATQAGTVNYLPAYGSGTVTILKAPQTVSLPTVPTQTLVLDKIVPLTISTSAATPIFLRNLTPNICIASGRDAQMRAAGLCRFEVSSIASTNYLPPAPVVLQFTIDPGPQKPLTLSSTRPNLSYGEQSGLLALGGSGSGAVSYVVTAGGGVCTVNGSSLTAAGVGTCTVTATKAADADFLVATASATFSVTKATQTVYFTGPVDRLLVANETIALTARTLSGQPITYSVDAASNAICSVSGSTLTVLSDGTCTVTAAQTGNANYVAAAATASFKIITPVQTITLTASGTQIFEPGRTINLTARSSAQLPVTIKTLTSTVCTVSNGSAILHIGGTCSLEAFNTGNATYLPASTQLSFTVNKINLPSITLKASPAVIAFGATTTLTTTGGSGSGGPVLSVTAGGSVCALSGNTLTGTSVGTCTLTASEAATPLYNAVSTTLDVTIAQADQIILFTPPADRPFKAGGTIALNASSDQGLPVSIITTTPKVCGVAGTTAVIRNTGRCGLYASNPGNQNISGTNTVVAFNITKATQPPLVVTAAPANITPGSTTTLSTTGGSGTGALSYSIAAGSTFCSLSGTTVTGINVGTCTLTATKATDANHNGDVSTNLDITVAKATQTITITPPGPQVYSPGKVLALSTTSSSGLPVSFASTTASICTVSGTTVTLVAAGTCSITASQAGDASFVAAANVVQTFAVTQGVNTIAFTGPADTALTSGPVTVAATSRPGLPVSFASTTASICTVSGTTVTLVAAGTCSITASQAGDANFVAAANVVQTFAVMQGANIITFNGPANTDFTIRSVTLSASASSGLAVNFASTTAAVCTVSGTTVTLVSVGTCSITASQAGDANFDAASDVIQTFAISGDTVITKTKAITSNYVSRRAGRILSGTPNIASRLGRSAAGEFAGAAGFSPLGLSGSGTLSNAKVAFSTSLHQVIGAGTAGKKAQRKELGQMMALGEQSLLSQYNTGTQPGFDIWVKGSLDHAKSDSRKSDLGLLFIGADYHLSETTLVGMLAQFDWSDEKDTTNSFRTDGRGWMIGPYLATRLGKNLLFDGRVAYGRSSNIISPFGTYEDSFDTTRWLVSGTLSGDFNIGSWRFSPHVGVSYFEETQKAYRDSIGNVITAQTTALGRMTFGPKVSTSFKLGGETIVSPHISVKGIWDFDKAQATDLATGLASGSGKELRASIEAGLTTQFANGWRLTGEGHYDGIGDDNLEAYGGSLKVTVPFN